jgi:predicted AlkP superfamily pyrophosphatase or phosphodiesterase
MASGDKRGDARARPEPELRVARGASRKRGARTVWVRLCALFVSAAVVFLAFASCEHGRKSARPLIVVGADGLEWRLLLRFAREEALPNITKMMSEGYAGRLETLEPTLSPVIWTTIATGKLPEQHGITAFSYVDAQGGEHLFTSLNRRSKAFWNLLTDAGETCHVDGWWCTWPVEEIEGSMVAQTTTRAQIHYRQGRIQKGSYLKGLPFQAWPDEVGRRMDALADSLAEHADQTFAATFGKPAHPLSPMMQMLTGCLAEGFFADALFLDAARDVVDSKRPFDLLAVYFGVTDVASHLFWRDFEPELYQHPPPAEELADFGHVIRDTYRFVDAAIGELRAKMPDADVILLSDHGFYGVDFDRDFDASFAAKDKRFDSGHHTDAPPGVFIACGPSFKRAPVVVGTEPSLLRTVGRVQDVLPTILALKDLPYGEDMAGKPMRQLFTDATLAAHPIRSVATHEDAEWRAAREKAREESVRLESRFEEKLQQLDQGILQTLQKLGYTGVGPQPADPSPKDPSKKDDGK